jgi:maltose-binding protein MalE
MKTEKERYILGSVTVPKERLEEFDNTSLEFNTQYLLFLYSKLQEKDSMEKVAGTYSKVLNFKIRRDYKAQYDFIVKKLAKYAKDNGVKLTLSNLYMYFYKEFKQVFSKGEKHE